MDYKAELLKLLENTDDWESLKTKLEHIYNMYMHYVAKYLTSVTLHEKEKYKRSR